MKKIYLGILIATLVITTTLPTIFLKGIIIAEPEDKGSVDIIKDEKKPQFIINRDDSYYNTERLELVEDDGWLEYKINTSGFKKIYIYYYEFVSNWLNITVETSFPDSAAKQIIWENNRKGPEQVYKEINITSPELLIRYSTNFQQYFDLSYYLTA